MPSRRADPPAESPEPTVDAADEQDGGSAFPIVGVGASAGGLEAFTQLLKAMPPDTGMAFVLVQHLAPSHPSALAEILSRATTMPVAEVTDEPEVEPNHVYVIPPDRSMSIAKGVLQLMPREGRGAHHPVDQFFRALAKERGHQAIGVVLSGTATDGTIGLEEIKAEGGITFAQDATAQHEGMPHSAIASGCVDFVLPPDRIAREIVRIGQHPYAVPVSEDRESDDQPNLAQVVQLLHQATGVDFTGYKFNTLYRRVTRRMVFQKLDSLEEYERYLRKTPAEVDALYQDILISVTSFFRDNESFEALKQTVFPRLLQDRSRHEPVRLWTLGCSTGQEAYSLVMAFTEVVEAAGSSVPLQLFASDLNAASIEKARAGIYPKDIVQDVSPERLRRFFTDVNGQYRIAKSIRDACVFSRHNVLADPPFSRIDLISCRNLLIYLEPVLQQRIVPTLHYALKPAGCLWLGGSETIGGYRYLFEAENPKHKIYIKKPGSITEHSRFPVQQSETPRAAFVPITPRPRDLADLPHQADRVLLTRFAPPGVLVSADLDILQYRGDTGPYLAPAPGKASLNLLKMLREGLLVAVRAAVLRAGQEQTPVRQEGLRVKSNGGTREVAIEVIPLQGRGGANEGGFLILFEGIRDQESGVSDESGGRSSPTPDLRLQAPPGDVVRLEQELAVTREYLQAVIEQQEAANEELQSANEEVQSANEELQSTNEELETSKEEIQSSNEELATVNDELNDRNVELHRVNGDLVNLIGSAQMPIVMLGPDLRVRRFTPPAEKVLNLIPTDVGRPLADIKLNLDGLPDLGPLLAEVLDTVSVKQCEVRDKHGRWHSLRLRPYRTLDNKIDGVVLVLVDVDAIKRAEEVTAHLAAIVTSSDDAIISKDLDGVITSWNKAAERLFGYTAEEAVGQSVALLIPPDRVDEEEGILERLRRGEAVDHYETVRQRKDGSLLDISLTISPIRDVAGRIIGAAKIARDVTEHKRMEEALRQSTADLSESDRRKDEFLAMLGHELRNPLAPLVNAVQLLRLNGNERAVRQQALTIMEDELGQMVHLVDDLLEVSRISTGQIHLQRKTLDLRGIAERAEATVRPLIEQGRHALAVRLPASPVWIEGDPTRLEQVAVNLLNNSAKYTDDGGRIELRLQSEGTEAVMRVRDSGVGIAPDLLPHVFDLFTQAERMLDRAQGGLGLGLALVRRLTELHGGTVEVFSELGAGSEFVVRLPLVPAPAPSPTPATSPTPAPRPTVPAGAPLRVLVVDDRQDAAYMLATLLKLSGHDVQTAADGPAGLAAALDYRPHVILLDIGLPGMNGYEVAQQIRLQPELRDVVLLAITGYGQEADRRRSKDAGFDHHLVKPADIRQVQAILADVTPT